MFIIQRREMQRMLTELVGTLAEDQCASLAARLNQAKPDRLAAMWELIWLYGLAGVGTLRHELPLADGARPDCWFEHDGLRFIADITTVTDAGLHKDNPLDTLWDELMRLARKHGLSGNRFGLDVEGEYVGAYGDSKVLLALPKRSDLAAFVKAQFEPFVKEAKRTEEKSVRHVREDGCRLKLTYDPAQRYAHVGHLSYDVAASLDRNPLGRRLRDKADQLASAPDDWLHGVIVCDGGCAVMTRYGGPSVGTYSRRQIALDIMRQRSSLDFVLLVALKSEWAAGRPTQYKWFNELVISPAAVKTNRLPQPGHGPLADRFEAALRRIPKFVNDPLNAGRLCVADKIPDMMGGFHLGGKQLKISSRALVRLLAGETDLNRFMDSYGWAPESEHKSPNPFARARREGRLIKSVTVEASESADDDWLVIEFGDPDPAIAPFGVRK